MGGGGGGEAMGVGTVGRMRFGFWRLFGMFFLSTVAAGPSRPIKFM